MKVSITPFDLQFTDDVKKFTDKWIGKDYYSTKELSEIYELGKKNGLNASFLAFVENELAGVRLTFAPGSWVKLKEKGLTPHKWNVNPDSVGYFKSLFISETFQKMGLGRKLSTASLETLKEMGADAVICHSWLESPQNSSQKYLLKMGFEGICPHPHFWYDIDYHCTRCGPSRCICTALEMIKYLNNERKIT